jgi:malonate-semialdehyde dehydrogenase (acetylating) / methylmalonate-semialdehyde dehydrogenase
MSDTAAPTAPPDHHRLTPIGHWIDGAPTTPSGARTGPVVDPATGQTIASVALATPGDVDAAVQAARRAWPAWRATPLSRRMPVLYALRDRLTARSGELARIIAAEHGKTVEDATGEIARGLEVVELACSAPQMLKGEMSSQVAGGVDTFSLRQPVGVCVGITPFNFPAMVPLWMFPVALACGNTFVLKPSERDPSAALLLARIAAEAGVPDGVLNVVQGDREAVDALLIHPDVAAVSFVGSTPVARHVYATAAAPGKRVQALGGAKNHLVVLADADLDQAADALVSAAFGSAGQRCMAVAVAVVVDAVADDLVARVARRAGALRVGPSSDPASEMGPLITRAARERVEAAIAGAATAGATIVADGRDIAVAGHENGFFVGPTVIDDVAPADVYREELFGPVLSVVRVADLDAALALVNAGPYGNGAAIFTADGAAARRFTEEVEAGMVGLNVPIPVPVGSYSFGGWGDSLFGDTHVYGPEGFRFYTRGKVVTSRWLDSGAAGVRLGFPGTS